MNNQTTLALDTCAEVLRVALSHNGCMRALSKKGIKQEEYLFPLINKLLAEKKLKLKDIANICVLKGPGRFTGIRIGITFSAVLSMLNGAKQYAPDALSVLAFQISACPHYLKWAKENKNGILVSVMHAFKDEYYCRIFAPGIKKSASRPLSKPLWMKIEELNAYLDSLEKKLYMTGDIERIVQNEKFNFAPKVFRKINPSAMIEMTDCIKPVKQIEPLYLKPAKYENKTGK